MDLDKYYLPIPSVEAYLRRIGLSNAPQPNLESLSELVYAHQKSIFFENLTPWAYRQAVSLGVDELFDKIIINRRGGFCFELNGLFCALLRALGYSASQCFARVIPSGGGRARIMHSSILVSLDSGKYFCDVGLGGPAPSGAVPIVEGGSFARGGEAHTVTQLDSFWYQLNRRTASCESQPLLQFSIMPQEPVDFAVFALYASLSPDSTFTQIPMLNRRTENGIINIKDLELTISENGKTEKRALSGFEELRQAAMHYFELEIPEK